MAFYVGIWWEKDEKIFFFYWFKAPAQTSPNILNF